MKDLPITLSLRQHGNACLMAETPTHRLHLWLDPVTLKPVDSVVFKNKKARTAHHRAIYLDQNKASGKLFADAMLARVADLYPADREALDAEIAAEAAKRAEELKRLRISDTAPEMFAALKLVEQAQRDGDYGKAFEAVRKAIAAAEGVTA